MKVNLSTVLMVLFVTCCTMSCKKDSNSSSDDSSIKRIEFEEDEITLSVGETYPLELLVVPSGADLPKCSFTSDDKSVATVNKSGIVTAVAEGEAVITAATSDGKFIAECYVTVTGGGGGGLYRDPYLVFGASASAVKNYETRQLAEETNEYLMYVGENSDIAAVMYGINSGKLYGALVGLNSTNNIEQRAISFLSGKYQYYGENEGTTFFLSSDQKIGVALYFKSEYNMWYVEYFEPSFGKSSFPAKDWKKMSETEMQLIKR
jgi:hypothetical protein